MSIKNADIVRPNVSRDYPNLNPYYHPLMCIKFLWCLLLHLKKEINQTNIIIIPSHHYHQIQSA